VKSGGEAILLLLYVASYQYASFLHTHTLTRSHTHTLTVVEVEFVQPMYTVPESNGTVTVCLESDIGTKTDFQVTVTASEKTPVDAQGS